MLKILLTTALLLGSIVAADARVRLRVEKPIAAHPYAVEYALASSLCGFAIGATKPGDRLPPCAQWMPRQYWERS